MSPMPVISGPGPVWATALGVAALLRGSAYGARPPTSTVSTPIEALMPWSVWAALLLVTGVAALVGVCVRTMPGRLIGWAGHILAIGLYLGIASSYALGAFTSGATWSGVAPVLIIAALHWACADRLGQEIRYGR